MFDRSAGQSFAGGASDVGLGATALFPLDVLGVPAGPAGLVVKGVTVGPGLEEDIVEAGCGPAPAAPPPGDA